MAPILFPRIEHILSSQMSALAAPEFPPPLKHPDIGLIQGRYGKGVIQYLGIKYASLRDRFSNANVVNYDGNEDIVATRHGPPVVLPSNSVDLEMSFIQQHLPKYDIPPMSDAEGLNLNITVPQEGEEDMPVLVYIHDGGFTFGSNSYPHYDQSKVVELSGIMDQRLVAVNINYRLGITGFMISDELRMAGYEANRGLKDQVTALKWVKRYISGFGGDPDRITVVGQSAGAASINFLMHSSEALFHQAILLGGSFLMMRPGNLSYAEQTYRAIVKDLGLAELPKDDRLRALLTLPIERLVAEITPEIISLGPVIDGEFIPEVPSFRRLQNDEGNLPAQQWCHRVFVIESQFDGSIFALVNLNARQTGINIAFRDHVTASLGARAASQFLQYYNIGINISDPETLEAIIQFVTDISFHAPAIKLAQLWPGHYYLGLFNERNPWDGKYKGRASHLLDTAYLWGNYNQKYERDNWAVARAMAENIISFAYDTDKLPSFSEREQSVMVYGPSTERRFSEVAQLSDEVAERDAGFFGLAKDIGGLDLLLDMNISFLSITNEIE